MAVVRAAPASVGADHLADAWDDPVQREDPNYAGGANSLSLNEARNALSQ